METLLVIGVIVVLFVGPVRILNWLVRRGAEAVAPDSKLTAKLNPSALQVAVDKKKKEIGGELFDCYQVRLKGQIRAPYAGFPYQFVVHLQDVTDGEEKPIICAIDQLQEAATITFEFRTDAEKLPYAQALIGQWVPVVSVPIDVLTLPRSGTRQIKCRLDVINAADPPFYAVGTLIHAARGSILETATTTITVESSDPGYEDRADSRKKLHGLTLKLAMAVSASDGEMEAREGDIIREWLSKQIAHIDSEDRKAEEKARLNIEVAEAYRMASENTLDVSAVCDEAKRLGTSGDFYDIVELCLHVAAADGEAQGAELAMTRRIAKSLGVNLDRVRSLEEKIVPISMHTTEQDSESLLGITSDMSPDEIRKHLNQEYRKWNSRSTHNDDAVRKQAEEMLKIIAECRRKYVA